MSMEWSKKEGGWIGNEIWEMVFQIMYNFTIILNSPALFHFESVSHWIILSKWMTQTISVLTGSLLEANIFHLEGGACPSGAQLERCLPLAPGRWSPGQSPLSGAPSPSPPVARAPPGPEERWYPLKWPLGCRATIFFFSAYSKPLIISGCISTPRLHWVFNKSLLFSPLSDFDCPGSI